MMWWLTKVTTTDGRFHAMLEQGYLPQGTVESFSKHETLDDALSTVANHYEKQGRGLIRVIGKPFIWTYVEPERQARDRQL